MMIVTISSENSDVQLEWSRTTEILIARVSLYLVALMATALSSHRVVIFKSTAIDKNLESLFHQ